tara:strand:- start:421 stop:588 length:168 start_codon:yes stop_codon:yes gene_type:complete
MTELNVAKVMINWANIQKHLPDEKKALDAFFKEVELEAARLELTCDYYFEEFLVA